MTLNPIANVEGYGFPISESSVPRIFIQILDANPKLTRRNVIKILGENQEINLLQTKTFRKMPVCRMVSIIELIMLMIIRIVKFIFVGLKHSHR